MQPSTFENKLSSAIAAQLERLRPTLVVGAGGTGQQATTFLKLILQTRYGNAWRQKIRLLAFDTAEEAFAAQGPAGPVRLESNVEFINIGGVPVPRIMQNLDTLEVIRTRMGDVMAALPPVVLRSGAKQLRPLGLLALLWHYSTVTRALRQAIWALAGRHQAEAVSAQAQQGINVFICGSLVGGTGSGAFLDLAYLIRATFDELGPQAEFCHITGVGVLPQAFHGIQGANLLPNAGAALEELNYLTAKSGFQAVYPDRQIQSRQAPFNLFYVVDGVDERGQTWPGITNVCAMIAEALALQIGSQLGQKGENAFDNMDEILIGQMPSGDGTFLSSFGIGYLEFDAPAVADICTRWFLLEVIQQGWLRPAVPGAATVQVESRLSGQAPAALTPLLLRDTATQGDIRIDLPLPTWLPREQPGEVAAAASRYVREYGRARVAETFLPAIRQNGAELIAQQREQWQTWFTAVLLDPDPGIAAGVALLQAAQTQLAAWTTATRKALAELEDQALHETETVTQLETAVAHVAAGFPVGRAGRIRSALTRLFQAAEALYLTQLQQELLRVQIELWQTQAAQIGGLLGVATALMERLAALANSLRNNTPQRLQQLAAGGVARVSLADEPYVRRLYAQHKPTWVDVKNQVGDPLQLAKRTTESLETALLAALRTNFHGITDLGIEQVIADRADEHTPEARRQQLFRLATPSWNVDRTRLPNGGADLARLETLGVPDATQTLFSREAMLVSTQDRRRLTALVVVAGAPQTALQQHGLYRQAIASSRNRRLLYVLPSSLADDGRGELAFALGHIFGLIDAEGTVFWYRPHDPLREPLRLTGGLEGALRVFEEQPALIEEILTHVDDQIAQRGLTASIELLTNYYSNAPAGNSRPEERLRALKRRVRAYAEDLRRIHAFSAGISEPAAQPA
jgi:hypothetical protein